MADSAAEGRIKDLKRRLELDPGSRLFVALAEEYRKTARLAEALSTLQKGLLAHPNYVSAQVALGRAYLEVGQITEAIATFSKVLSNDHGNLVAAKLLADIYLSRGESVEAIKKYKLYRALSGDRDVEELIARLEAEIAPPPPAFAPASAAPPPPSLREQPKGPIRLSRTLEKAEAIVPETDPFDITSVSFELPGEDAFSPAEADPFFVHSRDLPLESLASGASARRAAEPSPAPPAATAPAASAPAPGPGIAMPESPSPEDLATRAIRVGDILGPLPAPAPAEPPKGEPTATGPKNARVELRPAGRTLADLYFAQGHYAEALRIYDDLAGVNPYDEEIKRLRRDAEARLLPASSTRGAASHDPAMDRRLAKVRALKRWLSVVQAG